MGKKIQKKVLEFFLPKRRTGNITLLLLCGRRSTLMAVLLLTLLPFVGSLVGCGNDLAEGLQSGEVPAWDGLIGRWAGPVVPNDPSCGGSTKGLLSIGADGFGFDPFQSTVVITGKVANDGHLAGTLVRQGGDHQALSISFEAAPTDAKTISGTLASGRCHWSVTLRRS